MKTITEFSGFYLRDALAVRNELYQAKRKEAEEKEKQAKAEKVATEPTKATSESPSASTEAAPILEGEKPSSQEEKSSSPVAEASASPSEAPKEEKKSEEKEEVKAEKKEEDQKSESPSSRDKKNQRFGKKHPGHRRGNAPKPVIKFDPPSPEELKAALAEKLGLEGDKLEHTFHAIRAVHPKKQEDLRRVVVVTLEEGEKAPQFAHKEGQTCYIADYLPSLHKPKKKFKGKGPKEFKGKGKGRGGKGPRGRDQRRRRPDDGGPGRGPSSGKPGSAQAS